MSSRSIYRKAFFVTISLISVPGGLFIVYGLLKQSVAHISFWGLLLGLSWFAYWYLKLAGKYSFALSFTLVNLFWWPLMAQTVHRILSVLEKGGPEKATFDRSLIPFIMGMTVEQLYFLPLSIALFSGIFMRMKYRYLV